MHSTEAMLATFRHYVDRIDAVVQRIEAEAPAAFDALPFPGTFPAGRQLGVALYFAARGVLRPAGRPMPPFPADFGPDALHALAQEVRTGLAAVSPEDLGRAVSHKAGFAELEQDTADYMARFALPNLVFHFAMGYAAAKSAGVDLGKADFDGLHQYPEGFRF